MAGAIGVVGLGLMGGSLARALKARDRRRRVIAVEPEARTRSLAEADEAADVLLAAPGPALGECELVVLCTPAAATEACLAPVSAQMDDQAILTDVCGVKEPVIAAARAKVRRPVAFVGAHPMFGGAKGGYAAARADLWEGGTVAVCVDGTSGLLVEKVADLHRSLGAEVVVCDAAEHDAAVAIVSQLPYLIASALSLAAADAGPLAERLAGRSFGDLTRAALFGYDIQGEAARRNAHLGPAARSFSARFAELLQALAASPERAREALAAARAAKEKLS